MSKELKYIIRFLLPAIFITYLTGISFFMHTHIINGVTIVHSHPFDNDAEHNHNTTEIELIAGFNSVSFTDNIIDDIKVDPYLNIISIYSSPLEISFISYSDFPDISLRAPPTV